MIYLFRHGQSGAPPGCLVGRSDFALSPLGCRQAEYWRDRLSDHRFDLAVASPLGRARRTAEIILEGSGGDRPILEIENDFQEISLGQWEGRSKDWIQANDPDHWAARGRDFIHQAPPGGESFYQLTQRVAPAFQAWVGRAATVSLVLVVAHQAVIRAILTTLVGVEPPDPWAWPVLPASLAVLQVVGEGRLELARLETCPVTD